MKRKFLTINEITEIGILSALSLLLAYISKIFFQMPQGGNIGLDMIPVFFISLKRGIKNGLILGAIVGFLLLLTDYFVIHPFQLLLDYPFAHMALGLAGLNVFRNKYWIIGLILGSIGRFVFHYISGILYFTQFAPKGMNVHFYVASYILSHLIPGTIVAVLVIYLLRRRKEIWRI